jgi:hypothetical protein
MPEKKPPKSPPKPKEKLPQKERFLAYAKEAGIKDEDVERVLDKAIRTKKPL